MKKQAVLATLTVAGMALVGGAVASAVSYDAVTTISTSTSTTGASYASTSAPQNAIMVTGGTSTLTNATVTKSGGPSGMSDDYDFYGTNAAILVRAGTLNLSGGTITTTGSYASGFYSYGDGVANADGTTITTSANNSGGVMVTGGGTLTGTNLSISTSGGSSAALRSDKGGGTMTISDSTASTSGTGSPAIYSTAAITVDNSTLTSTHSEGVVIEGANSVTLQNGTTLTATNDKLNGQSTTYKGVFLYQSGSGDASGTIPTFTATGSTITNNKGDVFYATNSAPVINLTNSIITQNDSDGDFLRAEATAWGTSGSNGGTVTMTLSNQTVDAGDIIIDDISSLNMSMTSGSKFTGNIDNDGTAKLTMSSDSSWIISGDNYLTTLSDSDSTYANIYNDDTSVCYTLYVGGTLLKSQGLESGSTTCDGSSSQIVDNGIYIIKSALNSSKALDIAANSTSNGGNLQLYTNNGSAAQKFVITYLSDGYYKIEGLYSQKVLDVAGAGTANGTNVQQYTSNNTCAQYWQIIKSGSYYQFVSKCSGKYLDVAAGSTANGTNVQIYTGNSTAAQKFSLSQVEDMSSTVVSDGNYYIKSALNSSKVLDIVGASTANEGNVQLYDLNYSGAQKFKIAAIGNGFYKITNVNSGKVLDVAGAGTSNSTNVWQYSSNDTSAQQWLIKKTSNYYQFVSRCNGLYLDIAAGSTANGTNAQIYAGNSTAAQKFTLASY